MFVNVTLSRCFTLMVLAALFNCQQFEEVMFSMQLYFQRVYRIQQMYQKFVLFKWFEADVTLACLSNNTKYPKCGLQLYNTLRFLWFLTPQEFLSLFNIDFPSGRTDRKVIIFFLTLIKFNIFPNSEERKNIWKELGLNSGPLAWATTRPRLFRLVS